jgi:CrcB protein
VTILLIGAGGAAGAIARFLVDQAVMTQLQGRFPWGTLVVNVSGSFVIGLLLALVLARPGWADSVRPGLMIGFLGAYTTFSTLTLDSWRLVEEGSSVLAAVNIVGSIVIGLVAVVAGLALGRAIAG